MWNVQSPTWRLMARSITVASPLHIFRTPVWRQTFCPMFVGHPQKGCIQKKEQLGLWHKCEKVEVWPDIGWLEMAVSGLCHFIECPEQMFFILPIIHYHLCLLSPLFLALKKLKCIVRVEFPKLILRLPGKAPDIIS